MSDVSIRNTFLLVFVSKMEISVDENGAIFCCNLRIKGRARLFSQLTGITLREVIQRISSQK